MAFPHRLLFSYSFPTSSFLVFFFLNASNCAPKPLHCWLKAGGEMGILGRQFITISFVWEYVSFRERAGRVFFDECLLIKMTVMFGVKKVSFHIRKAEHLPSKNSPRCLPADHVFTPKRKRLGSPRRTDAELSPLPFDQLFLMYVLLWRPDNWVRLGRKMLWCIKSIDYGVLVIIWSRKPPVSQYNHWPERELTLKKNIGGWDYFYHVYLWYHVCNMVKSLSKMFGSYFCHYCNDN